MKALGKLLNSKVRNLKPRTGDWVEVRSREEILRTLDERGRLDELPFMPQMFQYCGQQFRIYKRAHKTCDTINSSGGRRLADAVHLEIRCNGEAFGGCQAACLIFWKTGWLKPLKKTKNSNGFFSADETKMDYQSVRSTICTEEAVQRGTLVEDQQEGEETRYVCQATQLLNFTTPLPWWNIGQYLEDYTSGNVTLKGIVNSFIYACFYILHQKVSRISWKVHLLFIWIYDKFQTLKGGLPYPRKVGTRTVGQSTPTESLNLQPGELVRVKPYEVILSTLDMNNKNRGMAFDAEMVPYCGGTYRVRNRVNKFIDEKTGKMSTLKTPAIIMENVWCQSRYSSCRMGCPRSIYSWWREIWLERVPQKKL